MTATLAGDGTGPTLLLNGHTDVVPPGDLDAWSGDPFAPRVLTVDGSDRIVARGACDMKAGVAAMWRAVRAVKAAGIPLRGSVILAPVSGEEDGGLGTFALLRHGVTADMCVIPEPTAMDVMPANGGALTFRLTVRGLRRARGPPHRGRERDREVLPDPAAPSRSSRGGATLGRRRHAALAPRLPAVDRHDAAGDWASTVPDLLTADGRLGVALGETVEQARAELEATVAAACAADPWLADHPVEVTWWGGQFASGRTPADAPVIDLVAGIHRELCAGPSPRSTAAPTAPTSASSWASAASRRSSTAPATRRPRTRPDEWVPVDEVLDDRPCARRG